MVEFTVTLPMIIKEVEQRLKNAIYVAFGRDFNFGITSFKVNYDNGEIEVKFAMYTMFIVPPREFVWYFNYAMISKQVRERCGLKADSD